MTANAGDCRNADVPLHAGGHRPQDIVAVKDVDIFIHQNNILARIGRQRQQRGLPLPAFIGGLTFFHLQDPEELTATRGVGVDIL